MFFQSLLYLRNKSWKSECALSFNMGWRILVFYPEPEANVACANEIIPNR